MASPSRVLGIEATGFVVAAPGGEFEGRQQAAAVMGGMGRSFDGGYVAYATFALRADVPVFAVSRFLGSSIAMIDRHYGHLARDSHVHVVSLLDALALCSTNAPCRRGSLRRRRQESRARPYGVDHLACREGVIGATAIMRWLVAAMHIELEPLTSGEGSSAPRP